MRMRAALSFCICAGSGSLQALVRGDWSPGPYNLQGPGAATAQRSPRRRCCLSTYPSHLAACFGPAGLECMLSYMVSMARARQIAAGVQTGRDDDWEASVFCANKAGETYPVKQALLGCMPFEGASAPQGQSVIPKVPRIMHTLCTRLGAHSASYHSLNQAQARCGQSSGQVQKSDSKTEQGQHIVQAQIARAVQLCHIIVTAMTCEE